MSSQEAGGENLHPVTRKVGNMKLKNSSRDILRFMRLPLDLVYVKTVVKDSVKEDEIVEVVLPMLDPHELLDWLWRTDRIQVSKEEILTLV